MDNLPQKKIPEENWSATLQLSFPFLKFLTNILTLISNFFPSEKIDEFPDPLLCFEHDQGKELLSHKDH